MLSTPRFFLSQQNRQQKQSLWALFLTGLVIVTCLASTLSANKVTFSNYSVSQSTRLGTESSDPQASTASSEKMSELYSSVFGSQASKSLSAPTSSACDLSSQLLTFATPKTGWLIPFILLIAVAFSLPPHISRLSRDNHRSARPTKHRLHLKHCIFRE
ncbi:hypothetical protein JC606_15080 [Vibrio sp. IB15]|uniref:hypothetical protein n=1 Tax=Vibrio TaxID=662 RepID=UPI0018E75D0A|nr:hypothetical protein [Vibrio sp. IB15]MBJ2147689.1 hypothetical protein [Vibrio sp. IB15]